jgi:hypothetical protein
MNKRDKKHEEQGGTKAAPEISLKSPRTAEACKRQGYLLHELRYTSLEKYKKSIVDPDIPQDIIELRWNAIEERRKKKIQNVIKERQLIIESEEAVEKAKNSAPGKPRK